MINSLDHDRRDDKLRLKLVNPNTQNLRGFQSPPHDASHVFNPFSGNGGSSSPATRGKPKSRGRRQTKIPPLPGTDSSTPSTVFSPPPLPWSEKKGIEQPEKKRRKTRSKRPVRLPGAQESRRADARNSQEPLHRGDKDHAACSEIK
jgi:hypothetical protein